MSEDRSDSKCLVARYLASGAICRKGVTKMIKVTLLAGNASQWFAKIVSNTSALLCVVVGLGGVCVV